MLGESNASSSKKGAFMWFKEIYSTCLLIFCSIIVLTVIFEENTTLSQFSSWAAFFVFWIALYWLSMVEGGQVRTVLQSIHLCCYYIKCLYSFLVVVVVVVFFCDRID